MSIAKTLGRQVYFLDPSFDDFDPLETYNKVQKVKYDTRWLTKLYKGCHILSSVNIMFLHNTCMGMPLFPFIGLECGWDFWSRIDCIIIRFSQ